VVAPRRKMVAKLLSDFRRNQAESLVGVAFEGCTEV